MVYDDKNSRRTRGGKERTMAERNYQKGEIIFREGDSGLSMFDIYWGKVGIYSGYGTEQERLLTELSDAQFFGEMGMLEQLPRSATAVALEDDTRVEEITEEEFAAYLSDKPMRVLMLLRQLSRRVRELSEERQ